MNMSQERTKTVREVTLNVDEFANIVGLKSGETVTKVSANPAMVDHNYVGQMLTVVIESPLVRSSE
jgi:hypothetical protein